jgi:hypothetical protein
MLNLDFSYPEDVMIKVEYKSSERNGWWITRCKVINDSQFIGAASYEKLFSGLLHYAMKDTLDKPEEGYHLISNVTARFGPWISDLDIQFAYINVTPITEEQYND